MIINTKKSNKALNKGYLKQHINRNQIDCFKIKLKILFEKADHAEKKKEYEDILKILLPNFLKTPGIKI
jgi:hypothetical protein